jgi:MoxR-like ATPase
MEDQRFSFLLQQPQAIIEQIIRNVEKVIIGKRDSIEKAVIAFLCGGHILLEDVPGVGKTMLVKALAKTIGCSFKRIQFTPDLLPSDITGVSVYNQKTGDFEFRPGPVMANIVLADEINRTSPKTQAALLEAMEERHVTVDGVSYPLPEPFHILATQNPLEYEGTFALPEAQMDRFLLKIQLGYPSKEHEALMLEKLQDKHPIDHLRPMMLKEELIQLQKHVRTVYTDESIRQYIVALSEATRMHGDVYLGASPRASMALLRASQAKAFMEGRNYVIPDDVKAMLSCVFSHRLILKSDPRLTGKTSQAVLEAVLKQTPVPSLRRASGIGG